MNLDCSVFYSSEQLGACLAIMHPWIGWVAIGICAVFLILLIMGCYNYIMHGW